MMRRIELLEILDREMERPAMAKTTEAACLLQSGAIYPQRIGFKTTTGGDILAGVNKSGAVSLYFGDAPIYHFDLDGRWQRAFIAGVHYLKGLDAAVQSIDRDREDGGMILRRRTLPFGQAVDIDASIRSVALDLIDDLDSGRLEILETPAKARLFAPEDLRTFLERVTDWDSAAWFAHRERYLGTFGPIPFLPPDCPNALVVQATLGNRGGTAFGRARPAEHYVRSLPEFRDHLRAVSKLVGRRISQYNGIFLAGADVAHRPTEELQAYLEEIGQVFPTGPTLAQPDAAWDEFGSNLGQIHLFIDDFSEGLPTLKSWERHRSAKLGRVTLGVVSGSSLILSSHGKNWRADAIPGVVADLKAAGIELGLVVLVGSGGRALTDDHLEQTITLLESLGLDSSNLITLVDARSLDQSPPEGYVPLSDAEIVAQASAFKSRLTAGRPSKGPKVVVYNPDKQAR